MRRGFWRVSAVILLGLIWGCGAARADQNTTGSGAPLRVAMAGLVHGHAGGFFHQLKNHPDIQIVGIAEPDRELFARYAREFSLDQSLWHADLDEMLQATHPQAVLAYTNTFDHRRVVEICAKRGIPVMMEKPLAVSYEDAKAIESAAKSGHIAVLVNYVTTWYRSNTAAYSVVHQNTIGDVRKIVIRSGHRGPKEIGVSEEFLSWLTDPKLNGGGALYDFGCYGADLATWLMGGARPTSVTAVTQTIKPDVYPKVDDDANIIVTYPRAQAVLQPSWNWPFDRQDVEIYGQTGYVLTNPRHDSIRVRVSGKQEEQQDAAALTAPNDDSMHYLRAVVLEGFKPEGPSSLEVNVIAAEILDAARRSASTGKTIQLDGK
jgi:scyllo-inositol 2-dehydrogenase (NADP+)